jgi:hypothetical protein
LLLRNPNINYMFNRRLKKEITSLKNEVASLKEENHELREDMRLIVPEWQNFFNVYASNAAIKWLQKFIQEDSKNGIADKSPKIIKIKIDETTKY